MQARTRRNRVAILVSMALCFTSTCDMQNDRIPAQRSRAANIAYAAVNGDFAIKSDEHTDLNASFVDSNSEKSADAYKVADWWKASLSEYDGSLSLVSYEAANTEPDEPLTMTTATISDESISNTEFSDGSDYFYDNSFESEDNYISGTSVNTTTASPAVTPAQPVYAEPGSVVFYTSGYGHGVGMSQNGANFYSMYEGWDYKRILGFYYPGTELVQTSVSDSDLITVNGNTDTVLSIISQICYNEMGSTFSAEAMKAQAVAAYTTYLFNGHGSGMICKANPPQNVVDAVRSVLGLAVYYNNKPACTSFYASSGGYTASCGDIFYGDIPYLISQPVKYDDSCDPNYDCSKVFSANELKTKLQNAYHVQLSNNPNEWIKLEYGDGGYVAYAVINGQVRVKGNELRTALGLRSPKFIIEVR